MGKHIEDVDDVDHEHVGDLELLEALELPLDDEVEHLLELEVVQEVALDVVAEVVGPGKPPTDVSPEPKRTGTRARLIRQDQTRSEELPTLPGPASFEPQPCKTWSLCNPYGPAYGSNLPLLLRRVADQLEHDRFEPMDFLGLTVDAEITEHGPWFSVSVFWSPDEPTD